MRVSDEIITLLRCPACGDGLVFADERMTCASAGCGACYPVVDGIPILIDEASSVFSFDQFTSGESTFFKDRGRLTRLLDRLLPTIGGANILGKRNYARFADLLLEASDLPRVLVIGGSILGSGMSALLAHPEIELVETDVSFGPRTRLICDAHSLPFADGSFDGVVAQAVLEHVADPYRCVDEMHRALKTNGVVYAETPFMQPVHGGRYDFTRFTALGHRRLFRRFAEIDSGAVCGPGMALAYAYQYFLLSFAAAKAARKLIYAFARLTGWFWKYFDYCLVSRPQALDAASGLYFLGRKEDGPPITDREIAASYRGGLD